MDVFDEIMKMHKDMDTLYDKLYRSNKPSLNAGQGQTQIVPGTRIPTLNLRDAGENLEAQFEMPGAVKENIQLKITDKNLSVKYEDKAEVKQNNEGFFRMEARSHSFYRNLHLPFAVDAEKSKAKFENGILKINMPKKKRIDNSKNLEIE